MRLTKLLAIGACAALAFTINTTTVTAHEGEDHGAKSQITTPDTAEGLLQEIQKEHGQITSAVTGKQLKEVHAHTDAITELAKALPDKVAADKKARVLGSANNLTKAAGSLHEAADGGDQAKSEAELKKLDGVVMALAKQVK